MNRDYYRYLMNHHTRSSRTQQTIATAYIGASLMSAVSLFMASSTFSRVINAISLVLFVAAATLMWMSSKTSEDTANTYRELLEREDNALE